MSDHLKTKASAARTFILAVVFFIISLGCLIFGILSDWPALAEWGGALLSLAIILAFWSQLLRIQSGVEKNEEMITAISNQRADSTPEYRTPAAAVRAAENWEKIVARENSGGDFTDRVHPDKNTEWLRACIAADRDGRPRPPKPA